MGGVEKWVKWGNMEDGLEGERGGKVKRRDGWSGECGGMAKEEEWFGGGTWRKDWRGNMEEGLEGERGGKVKRRDGWSGESGGMVQEEEWLEWGAWGGSLEWRNGVGQRGLNSNSYDDKVCYVLTRPI